MDGYILSNIYIFHEIFEYLNLEELLVAAKVSTRFRTAIIEYLQWEYKKVEAFKTNRYYIVSNKVSKDSYLKLVVSSDESLILPQQENRIILSHSDYLEFLNLNSNNIETLLLHFNDEYEAKGAASYYEDTNYLSKFEFNQLKRLGFGGQNLSEAQINCILSNCPNLKELYFREFCTKNGFNDTCWFTNIPVNNLDNKKIIKCVGFSEVDLIDGYYSHREKPFVYIEHLKTEKSAQTHVVNLVIENNSISPNSKSINNQLTFCEVLEIGQFVHRPTFIDLCQRTLSNIVNLRKLTIVSAPYIEITKEFFTALNNNCKYLKYLQLEYCGVREFLPIHTLEVLELNNCLGFSCKDLKTILGQHAKLKTFSSTLVIYNGRYEDFEISQQLQYLNLRYNLLNNNLMSLNLTNLTSLHWSSKDLTKQPWLNATNFPNLQILEVKTSHLYIENILHFKCLKKLTLNVSEVLSSVELWTFLQHRSLIYLAFNEHPLYIYVNVQEYISVLKEENHSCDVSVLFLDVCLNELSIYYLDFWLTLLDNNVNLTLRIKYNCLQEDNGYNYVISLLKYILAHTESPCCLKVVNICGFNIDLNKLRDNFDETLKKAHLISKGNFNNNKMQYILLKS